jgi:hypothetical protein
VYIFVENVHTSSTAAANIAGQFTMKGPGEFRFFMFLIRITPLDAYVQEISCLFLEPEDSLLC